ncbi:hypothetical protein [Atopobium sp. oral taxon 416]|uniref:hypothetical protein n=1 Tax=Atopobium sp. oral taxon 416 TaxID=712157 RepID=UPI001BA86ECE|nr:hypothetical protein [Atopobium sp. oral taxon 416]QUC02975.1 hypothetical protein J4859_13390 [Atopobium sp. oral taxon 416]
MQIGVPSKQPGKGIQSMMPFIFLTRPSGPSALQFMEMLQMDADMADSKDDGRKIAARGDPCHTPRRMKAATGRLAMGTGIGP